MKRLVLAAGLSALVLSSSGCCVRGLCMRGGPCNFRLPNPLRVLHHRNAPAPVPPVMPQLPPPYAQPMVPMMPMMQQPPCPSCPPAPYEAVCGEAMYAPYVDEGYETTVIPSGPIVEVGPTEGVIVPSTPSQPFPPSNQPTTPPPSGLTPRGLDGAMRSTITYPVTSAALPQPPEVELVEGPEVGLVPE